MKSKHNKAYAFFTPMTTLFVMYIIYAVFFLKTTEETIAALTLTKSNTSLIIVVFVGVLIGLYNLYRLANLKE